MDKYVIWFQDLGMNDVPDVGGKNASLGEMIRGLSEAGVRVPGGFATTSYAFREFLRHEGLADRINNELSKLDVDDINALREAGARIRQWVVETPFPPALNEAITEAWNRMMEEAAGDEFTVAVRSSATAEDLPDASFAGQQETFLNIQGLDSVLHHIHEVFASLYNDRAISYRVHRGFDHSEVALSAGVQRMVRSDIGASGVMFTLDTESGFRDVVFVTASWGLGETVVQGSVNPDEFHLYKPSLEAGRPAVLRRHLGSKAIQMTFGNDGQSTQTIPVEDADRNRFCINDKQLEELARQAVIIEKHYGRPMDIEWALDGVDGELYIVQARPETVESRQDGQVIERFRIRSPRSEVMARGRAIGQRIGAGKVRVVMDLNDMHKVEAGDVLVTDMTDPDWEPVMKRAAAIVTDRGGRTCHAAIIARELGIPAVVGCGDASSRIKDGQEATVSCAEGDEGRIYKGILDFEVTQTRTDSMPEVPCKVMMNVGNPGRAFHFRNIPNAGVGLARLEFIINSMIGVHPKALLNFDSLSGDLKEEISRRIAGYDDPVTFYVEKLVEGIATLGAAFNPQPVIVRLSDFKSNEYANLLAGEQYEPDEENPMIGYRGTSRYLSENFRDCFELECRAVRKVRDEMGLTNVVIMVPFVRTLGEAEGVINLLAELGLKRGENGLKIYMMCEIPSNAVLAEQFLEYFDGFSIGSNDLTQLTLGLDRDSGLVAATFDERDPAVKALLSMAIQGARKAGKYVGICGQGPSDYPDLAEWLMQEGIESISLNPDTVVETWLRLAGDEKGRKDA
ncbi:MULTISPECIES: phosphoenolpyruvate synthase [unclassified Ectothiorhodospira]|uniref:phosphoenolpyruvate synthase n=1 Tax=unclassified Ectothiorhodospira TaxID=2684909 RepID=UPI001EE996AB|nr:MULTISPECIES: phosphoenolpyruvate synthase [unclassified Ectothiorhodospira]MCG5514713.1 phosphoenolpyruvate synthase [Ectothiorhodospira sp. 9100]MCG5518312.1 phosphoenolpyruvate synthase [Ectothiorhodospira sp. 9905]